MNYIFPNPEEEILIVVGESENKGIQMGARLPKETELYKKIMMEIEFPFHKSAIKLNQCTRNLMKDFNGPNVLLLSKNEGCFAKRGLKLKEERGYSDYSELNYVDLVLDEERLEDGNFDIFTHELGHVMMNNILKELPNGKSTKQHTSAGITDYFTAFSEGWAIHFERLTYDSINYYKEKVDSKNNYDKAIVKLWQCEADSELRLNGVLNNVYINKKLLPSVDISNMDIKDIIILEHTSPIFDKAKLKNPQEMLSCEGVIATLFYRINTNKVLQTNYMPKGFYNNFLVSDIDDESMIRELFTPFENVILKNYWVWHNIREKLSEDSTPFIEFIKGWCECFPQDKPEIIKIFLSTTIGKTINNELSDIYENLAYNGMVGKINEVIKGFKEYKSLYNSLCNKVESGEISIDSNIGKEIWIENKNITIPSCFWSEEEMLPLRINLNTASAYDLMSFHNIDIQKAKEIINERDRKGYFKSIDSFGEEFITK